MAIKHKTEIPKDPKSLNPHISDDLSFENQTGDKAFDYLRKAIPNLLITSLETQC